MYVLCMYVWYLELSRKPRHVAQQMRYQNVDLRNGHCLGTLSSVCDINERAARENAKISSAQSKNAREHWQQPRVRKVARFSISLNLELLFCEIFDCKEWVVLVCLNSICTAACADKRNFSTSTNFEGIKTVQTVSNIGRHYMISSAIRKIKKGKQFVRTFWKFCSACGLKICSVNLDRETTFLTLQQPTLSSEDNATNEVPKCRSQ